MRLSRAVLFLAVLLLPALAFAQAVAPGSTVDPLSALLAQAVVVGCGLLSERIRAWAPQGHFFHTKAGAAILSVASTVLAGIGLAVAAHGLSLAVILTAVLSGLSSLLGTSNPSVPAGQAAPLARPPGATGVVPAAILLLMVFGVAGCLPPPAACVPPVSPTLQSKCNFENNLISCGTKSGLDLIPIVADVIMSAIGGTFDSATLVAELESEGFGTSIPCVLAAVESYLMPAAPQIAAKVHEALAYKLKKDGRTGTVDVKLKSGYIAHVILTGAGA